MSTVLNRVDREAVATGGHYTRTAQLLHWISAALMFTVLPLAWVMVSMPRTDPSREWMFTLHKSVGLTILALAGVRLLWRARHHAPPLSDSMAGWERASAFASHWLLYLVMVGMPVSGYVISAAGGHPVTYFDLFTLPGLPNDPAISRAGAWMHVAVGQWAVYALVLLHLGAAAWHVALRRDGTLDRMLPPQDRAA